ncbi:MAG: hypothetical protein XD95_0546 [Microgenomates bacterium 39_7]|nr:MAG: hypothetical protein XD95_0546 [Microgenomates bacterium 39_7]
MFTNLLSHPLIPSAKIELSDYLRLTKLENNPTVADTYGNFGVVVNLIVSNIFVLAGIVIFFLVIGAGFSYLQDSEKGKDDAKNLATGAVIGFLVMFSAYWIVQIIKLVTRIDNLPI